jgi:hypothetical protein
MKSKPRYPSEAVPKFAMRLPPVLKHSVSQAGKAARRSATAEIVLRLQMSLQQAPEIAIDDAPPTADFTDRITFRLSPDLHRRIARAAARAGRSMNREIVLRTWRTSEAAASDPPGDPQPFGVGEAGDCYGELTPDERRLLEIVRRLSPRRRRALIELLTGDEP